MEWPAAGAVIVALAVVLSAIPGSAGATSGPIIESTSAGEAHTGDQSAALCEGGPPAPETDVIGWEAGCWFNQSIAIDQTDGLNATERNATVARTMARVEYLRQLEFEQTVPVEIMSRESYRESQMNNSVDPALATFDNAKFKALFLVGDDQDSIAVQNQNAGAAILGFYSSQRKAIVLISENASTPQVDELTLAHELMHALQDQHFNLSRYNARTRDGANAENGLIEGDAALIEYQYQDHCDAGETGAWNGTCLSQTVGNDGSGGGLANIGTYFVKFQPYSDGPTFITSLYREGGWKAVNAAYDSPPVSSTQIIHPEQFPMSNPSEVALEDRNGDGWDRVRPPNRPDYATVGEAALTSMLVFPLYDSSSPTRINPNEWLIQPNQWLNQTAEGELSSFDPLNYHNRYAAGWNGDRLHVYVNDQNETAYVWRLAWVSPADAREFVDGYGRLLEYWGGERLGPNTWVIQDGGFAGAYHVSVEDDTVTIVNAPSVEALSQVRAGISVASPTVTTGSPGPATEDGTATVSLTATPLGTDGQPGFGPIAVLAALAALLLWRRG